MFQTASIIWMCGVEYLRDWHMIVRRFSMKKVSSILVCILFLSFVNACSHNGCVPNYNNESTLISKSYIVDKKLLEHDGDKISWKLEYPVLNNEKNYYSEVNGLLLNEIVKLTELPYNNMELEGNYYYTGNYEIMEQTQDIVSLCYVISVFYEYGANPIEYCYGLTIDIDTGEKIALSAYVEDLNVSLQEIEKGNYSVSYGAFSDMSDNEVRSELEKEFSDSELNLSYNNFYIDDGSVNFIINGVIGSDYAVIKLS